jgi:hypothetical protein
VAVRAEFFAHNQIVFSCLRPHIRLTENNPSVHCLVGAKRLLFTAAVVRLEESMAGKRFRVAMMVLLLAIGRPSRSQESAVPVTKGEHRILFHVRGDYIFVPARVNGRQATLLLDTGAALSTFSIKILPSMDTDHRITMNLAKGSVPAFVVLAGFTLGDSEIKEQQCSFRRNIVVGDFKFGDADGVIGLDVLSSFKTVTFDFKDSVLVLEDR